MAGARGIRQRRERVGRFRGCVPDLAAPKYRLYFLSASAFLPTLNLGFLREALINVQCLAPDVMRQIAPGTMGGQKERAMPTTDSLNYLAAALKFSAVPAAAFELIPEECRDAIESWLVEKLPKLIKSFSIIFLFLYVCVLLLAKFGPYLLLFFLFFRGTDWLILLVSDGKLTRMIGYSFIFFFGILVAAIFEKWILPESWVLAIAYPFEVFSVWANGNPYVDWILPDYSGSGFLEHFRQVFLALENWLWNWLAFLSWIYFFLGRGFMLFMVVFIQILFFLGIIIAALLAIWLPLCLFIQFSDFVKHTLRIVKGRIPVGAFTLWAIGETLEFGLKTLVQFQKDE
jgi:hypothetical protein